MTKIKHKFTASYQEENERARGMNGTEGLLDGKKKRKIIDKS